MRWPVARLKHVAQVSGRIGWHGLSTDDYADVGDYLVTGTEIAGGSVEWRRCHRVSRSVWERDFHIQLANGDVLVTKDGTIGKVAVVRDLDGCATLNSGIFRLRPAPIVLGHYLYWVMNSALFADFIELLGQGSTINHLYQGDIVNFCLPLPPLDEQWRIADYLDTETTRIDALIEKKQRLVAALSQRRSAFIENAIRKQVAQYGSSPLKYAVDRVEVGIVITPAAWYSEAADGVLALRGTNISPGAIDTTETVLLSQQGHAVNRKSQLSAGDVVVVRTGQAGAAAVVPDELEGANCIDLIIVRPSARMVPKYLELVLNSAWTQKHIKEFSVGTIQSHFNVGTMKLVPVPVPPIQAQRETVRDLGLEIDRVDALFAALGSQIRLLSERRQALITAAVTGEFEIPGKAA